MAHTEALSTQMASENDRIRREIARLSASIESHKRLSVDFGYPIPSTSQSQFLRLGNKLVRASWTNPAVPVSENSLTFSAPRIDTQAYRPSIPSRRQSSLTLASSANKTLVIKDGVQYTKKGNTLVRSEAHAQSGVKRKRPLSEHRRIPARKTIVVQGVQFSVSPSGTKLIRIDTTDSGLFATTKIPKHVKVNGTAFVRTKRGNLMLKPVGSHLLASDGSEKPTKRRKKSNYCRYYTRYGRCKNGVICRYVHDPNRVAICTRFLKGTCDVSSGCTFSHSPNEHNMPVCVHFERGGKCTNVECKYLHVKLSQSNGVCRDFATEGYCENGLKCTQRHVFRCPDFEKDGRCSNDKCRLPHVVVPPAGERVVHRPKFRDTQNGNDIEVAGDDENLETLAWLEEDLRPIFDRDDSVTSDDEEDATQQVHEAGEDTGDFVEFEDQASDEDSDAESESDGEERYIPACFEDQDEDADTPPTPVFLAD
ncbi:hypothetical protein BJ742DRAFT_789998 [Cladochytrium replicatum]|nr:hypothetical protein BJ742DRAFT_789998 [Cladochytrium replicatum]